MLLAAQAVTALVALVHVYIVVLEGFLWGRAVKVFGIPRDQRENPLLRTMLQNQGAYNGVLVAGLGWSLAHPDPAMGRQLALFFLAAVAAMGVVGALTADRRILLVQTVPAAVGLGLWLLA